MQVTGDFATAEDLVQDAVLAALAPLADRRDPRAARRLAVHRRAAPRPGRAAARSRLPRQAGAAPVAGQPEPDDRLRLIFTCCHPALPREAQIALTLRVVCGMTTAQIARAFLVPETTMAQRITRAKRKITMPGFRTGSRPMTSWCPAGRGPGGDLPAVQRGLPEHRRTGAGPRPRRRRRVAGVVLHDVDADRTRGSGPAGADPAAPCPCRGALRRRQRLVLLPHQDRTLWDGRRSPGDAHTDPRRQAAAAGPVSTAGRDQSPAMPKRKHWADTDWEQILVLYDMLLHLAPSPVTRLHRTIALRYLSGPKLR